MIKTRHSKERLMKDLKFMSKYFILTWVYTDTASQRHTSFSGVKMISFCTP